MILFRQHWLGLFHVQFCLEPRGQHCKGLYLYNVVPRVISNIEHNFFLCNVFWSLLDNIAQGFYQCNVVSTVLRQHWTDLFPMQCCLKPLGQLAQGFYLLRQHGTGFFRYNVVQRELRQHWTRCFLVKCCLEPQGQHYIEYLLEQYCPKSIKTTLNMIFSYAMLPEASWQHCTRFLPE